MRKIFFVLSLGSLLFTACTSSKPTSALSETDVTNLVNARDFLFQATQMLPQGGRTRLLTENYQFQVTPNQVVSDLPYMGKAYSANIGTSDGGMRFTSRDYNYQQNPGKSNSWTVNISPKDVSDPRECILNIYSNGSADLLINSNNRQPIRYTGNILPNVKKQ